MTEATKKLAEALHEHIIALSDGWLVRPVYEIPNAGSEFAVQADDPFLLRISVVQVHPVPAQKGEPKPYVPTPQATPAPKLTNATPTAIAQIVRRGLHAEDFATGEPTLPTGVTVHKLESRNDQDPQFRLELTESGEEYTVSVKKTRHCPSVGDPIPEGSVWQVWWSPAGNRPGDSTRMSYYTARTHSEACRAWSEDSARQENDVLRNASLYSSPIVEPEPEARVVQLSDVDRALLQRIAENGSPLKFTYVPLVGDTVEGDEVQLSDTKPATMRVTLAPEQIVRDRYNAGEYNGAPLPMFEDAVTAETPYAEVVAHKESTLSKVRSTLLARNLSADDIINALSNEGILFRERLPEAPESMKHVPATHDPFRERLHFQSQSYERMLTSDEVTELRHKVGLYVSDARASFSGTAVPDAVARIMGALQR